MSLLRAPGVNVFSVNVGTGNGGVLESGTSMATPTHPRFTYSVNAFDSTGAEETVPGTAAFNAFSPAVSNAMFMAVPVNRTADVPISVNKAEFLRTPALGFMVVTEDNVSGGGQANLLKLSH